MIAQTIIFNDRKFIQLDVVFSGGGGGGKQNQHYGDFFTWMINYESRHHANISLFHFV